MKQFKKPIAGETPDLIFSAEFQQHIVEVVNAYNRGELTRQPDDVKGNPFIQLESKPAENLEAGNNLSIDVQTNVSMNLEGYKQQPTVAGNAMGWHDSLARQVPLERGVLQGKLTQIELRSWIPVEVTNLGTGTGDFVMPDPDTPQKFKRATSGIGRILTVLNRDNLAIVYFHDQQKIWGYELTQNSQAPSVTTAKLLNLDDNEFASNIQLSDELSITAGAEEGQKGLCVHAGGKFWAISGPASAGEPRPWIRFRTTSKMTNRQCNALVELSVNGGPFGGGVGATVLLSDPSNQWPEAETGATGIAYLRTPTNSLDNPPSVTRWEIEECTLPVNWIKVYLPTCLRKTDLTITGTFGPGGTNPVPDWKMSGFPHVDPPPEVVEETPGQGDFSLQIDNPLQLDAVLDSYAWARRQSYSDVSDVGNVTVPKATGSAPKWELTAVTDPHARWLCLTYQGGGTWYYDSHSEGADPRPCYGTPSVVMPNVTVACGLNTSYLCPGDKAVAKYNPEADNYEVISTQSALLGAPALQTFLVDDLGSAANCGITYKRQQWSVFDPPGLCPNTPPTDGTVTPSLTAISFVNGAYLDCNDGFCLTFGTALVCGASFSGGYECYDICQFICDCCDWIFYILPEGCDNPDPPKFCDCQDCHFGSAVPSVSVIFGSTPYTASLSAIPTDPCCWDGPISPGTGQMTVCYRGQGEWEVNFSIDEPTQGTEVYIGVGDCTGAEVTGQNDPSNTGTVSIDGFTCTASDCCQTFDGDEFVAKADASFEDWQIIGETGKKITGGSNDACNLQVNIKATATNQLDDSSCIVDISAKLQYDKNYDGMGSDECRWHIVISDCITDTGQEFGGGAGIVPFCLGGDCNDPAGVCGDFETLEFEITDPNGSVNACNDPEGGMMAATALMGEIMMIEAPAPEVRKPNKYIKASTVAGAGLGSLFAAFAPELFTGCGCKHDIIPVMNRWGTSKAPTKAQVERVVQTLANKTKRTRQHIEIRLAQFLKELTVRMEDNGNRPLLENMPLIQKRLEGPDDGQQ